MRAPRQFKSLPSVYCLACGGPVRLSLDDVSTWEDDDPAESMRPSRWSLVCDRHDVDELRSMGYPACSADAVGSSARHDAIRKVGGSLSARRVVNVRRARLCYDAILVEFDGGQRLHLFSFAFFGNVGLVLVPPTHVLPPEVFATAEDCGVAPGDVFHSLAEDGRGILLSLSRKRIRCESAIWALNAAMTPSGPTEYGLELRLE
jgi:hypothetical protein